MLEAAKDHHEFMSYFFENDPENGCCLGLSYDPATHSTYALLLGLIDRPGRAVNEELADEIHRSAMSAWHPLLLPLLLLQQRSERIAAKVTAAIGTGFEFDLSRGFDKPSWQQYQQNQKKGQAAAQAKANLKISDFESPILRLSALSADVGFIQLVLELLIATLQKVQALLDTVVSERIVTAGVSQTNDVSKEDLTAQIRKTHDVLLRDIFYIDSVNTSRLLRITQIKEKLQIQLHAIQNLIAQRDNRINMSDSSSVKTISVVIMAFLPGTFIASFFTMPLSDWALDSAVTGQVWKYMVGIVPTAAIAFLAWLFFLWRMEIQRHKAAPHDLDDQQHLAQQTMDGTGPRPQNGRQQQKGPSPNKKGYFVHWSRQRQRERSSTSTVQKRHIS
ncbi:hypothetical protein CALVIDRAFT_538904 [Calocera viscosa TUFC12733]|uniref:Cora-domain-containing protein n=1 Tax=Calocera viscosa (strain TUFC12733) TaxID=1330018 RepID=A0A167KAV1_CALVF|nr:hypothetical protein CALVIDRAFT_538904 [Calocera viscosa TUFC12733]